MRKASPRCSPSWGEDKYITAGNASQLSDGASACVVMDGDEAARRGIEPMGIYKGLAIAGCEPDEMGIGPVFAVPRLLERFDLSVDDIDLWELNEAFAVQVIYCRDRLGIPQDKLNVDGGSISIGHPYGMSGARMVGHALIERQAARRQARGLHHVHRRRHGRGGTVRSGVRGGSLHSTRHTSNRHHRACLGDLTVCVLAAWRRQKFKQEQEFIRLPGQAR